MLGDKGKGVAAHYRQRPDQDRSLGLDLNLDCSPARNANLTSFRCKPIVPRHTEVLTLCVLSKQSLRTTQSFAWRVHVFVNCFSHAARELLILASFPRQSA